MGSTKKKKALNLFIAGAVMLGIVSALLGRTARAEGFYGNSFISFSPDHGAWTVKEALPKAEDASNKVDPTCWYPYGETIRTGMEGHLDEPGVGEHFYRYKRNGIIPIGKWMVAQHAGRCIHNDAIAFHELSLVKSKCLSSYYSGWFGYCADCGERVNDFYVYMSREKLARITEIDADLDYFYLCPTCGHLEQGKDVCHMCKAVSANRYRVRYLPNGGNVAGFMQSSYHMYGNAELFEGEPVTPVKMLSINSYSKPGFIFAGWNTMPDGSGEAFADGQEILNLSDENYDPEEGTGTVLLYAQWKKVEGILEVDPAGGKFQGQSTPVQITVGYEEEYTLRESDIEPPRGYVIRFEVDGGEPLDSVSDIKMLAGWRLLSPAYGALDGNQYRFLGENGQTDHVQAYYHSEGIILPLPKKEGYGFGGWYYDAEGNRQAGNAGDCLIPQNDLVLYANWVELVLDARVNLKDHGGKGAVDLRWSQPDGNQKTYLIYQKREGEEFQKIHDAGEEGIVVESREFADVSHTETFQVEFSGFYKLTAKGAQGQGYENGKGGLGGSSEGIFYLTSGDVIEIQVGGSLDEEGGRGEKYGSGGGRTILSSAKLGVLLVAGGGGGALPGTDGGEGGSENGLREDNEPEGQDGMAGGGAGWIGGKAGIYEQHIHTRECIHVHAGNTISGGDCYREVKETKECHVVVSGPRIDWGKIDNCDSCIRAGRNGYGSMHPRVWRIEHFGCGEPVDNGSAGWWQCEVCGEIGYKWGSGTNAPSVSDHTYAEKRYVLDCDKEFDCGNPPGKLIKSCGGSNYVNEAAAISYAYGKGIQSGNGEALVEAVNVGFYEVTELDGVYAPDLACPDIVAVQSVRLAVSGMDELQVTFDRPQDYGTVYFQQVHSYLRGNENRLSSSNITCTEIITGIAGYYYSLDDHPDTRIVFQNKKVNAAFTGMEEIRIASSDRDAYLHIAALDKAGNLGETATIKLDSYFNEIAWELRTEEIEISSIISGMDYGSVAKDEHGEKRYYVRANGRTPFLLKCSGIMCGNARANYQIDRMTFDFVLSDSEMKGGYTTYIPLGSVDDEADFFEGGRLGRRTYGIGLLQAGMFANASRTDMAQRVFLEQSFSMDAGFDGKTIKVIPIAGAKLLDQVCLSSREEDEEHGIWLIGDGTAPEIGGLNECESILLAEREENSLLLLTATDTGSGVAEFEAILRNLDNGNEAFYRPDEDGKIRIMLDVENELFIGDLQLQVRAVDLVGNVNEVCCGTQDFGLKTEVVRILSPHEPVFMRGESGILRIRARGYVERIEVEFPEEFTAKDPSLNRTFFYEDPQGIVREEIIFMVPLYLIQDREYEVVVKAYKGDGELEDQPALNTIWINGTVLGEIRTRLR